MPPPTILGVRADVDGTERQVPLTPRVVAAVVAALPRVDPPPPDPEPPVDPPPPPPVKPPEPPVIDVGDTTRPLTRVLKSDPPARLQALLGKDIGGVELERDGVWPGAFRLANKGKPFVVGAFGSGKRPVLKGKAGDDVLTLENLKAVIVEDVDFTADGKHDKGRSHPIKLNRKIGSVAIRRVKSWGFNQGVSFQSKSDGGQFDAVSIDGLVSTHNEGAPGDAFAGQGIYLAGIVGRPEISNSVFARNGRKADGTVANTYRHGAYCQYLSAAPIFRNCVFADNAHSGFQSRFGVRAIDCFFGWNGTSMYLVGGGASIENFAVVGGHRWWAPSDQRPPGSWIGNIALGIITPVYLYGGVVIGVPGQGNPQTKAPNGKTVKSHDLGCFQLSRDHGDHPEWSEGAEIKACEGVTVADNWPGDLVTGGAAGELDAGRLRRAKVTRPAALEEIRQLVNQATAGDLSVSASRLVGLARGAAGA